jgi:hypothetical protein
MAELYSTALNQQRSGHNCCIFVVTAILTLFVAYTQNKSGIVKNKIQEASNITPDSSARIWRAYGCVAHFWAAYMVSDGVFSSHEDEAINFLSFAEFMRRFATTYRPDRGPPIIDPAKSIAATGEFIRPVELDLSTLEFSAHFLEKLGLSLPKPGKGLHLFTEPLDYPQDDCP